MSTFIDHIESLVVRTEAEALLTEQNFIKQYRPRFNIRLRDDKSYPYIAISLDEDYPRVYFTRERHRRDRGVLRAVLERQARARHAGPARQDLPVPLLRGHRARAPLRLALPGLLHQALRGALRRLRQQGGVPRGDRRRRRVPLGPVPADRARPRAADALRRGRAGLRAGGAGAQPAAGGAGAAGAPARRPATARARSTPSRWRSTGWRRTRRCSRCATACCRTASRSTSTTRASSRPRSSPRSSCSSTTRARWRSRRWSSSSRSWPRGPSWRSWRSCWPSAAAAPSRSARPSAAASGASSSSPSATRSSRSTRRSSRPSAGASSASRR